MIIESFLCMWHCSKRRFLAKLQKRLIFGHFCQFLPSFFCEYGANHLKLFQMLLLNKIYMMCRIHDHSAILALVADLEKKRGGGLFLSIFKSILPPEDDVIENTDTDLPLQFSRRFQKSNWFCSRHFEKVLKVTSYLEGTKNALSFREKDRYE